jgi:hypothetical protein
MRYDQIRTLLLRQWKYTGGPNEAKASELYFAEPFPAPEWRRPWAEEGAAPEAHGDLPAHIRGGS